MSKKYVARYALIIFGLGIIIILARRFGIESIIDNLRILHWRGLPILLIPTLWYLCYTVAWNQFLKRLKGSIGLWELFRAKISGEAVNTITPANFLGGDPVRIYILKRHFPITEGAASVVVDRTLHTMAILMVIFVGIIAAFWRLHFLPLNMRYGLPIILIISSLFMGLVFTHQKRGLFNFLMYLLKKLRIKRTFSTRTVEKLRELDGYIADFYLKNPRGFWTALALHFIGRMLGILEIFIVGKIFYPGFNLYTSLLLCALAPLVNFIFAFIPGALGVMEGAYSGVLYLLHMPPEVGMSVQIFKRARALFWIVLGLVFLGALDRKRILHPEVIEGIQSPN